MPENNQHSVNHRFTIHIIIAMVLGALVGLLIKWLPLSQHVQEILADDILKTGGQIFLNLIKMIVVPIVLVSIVCGTTALGDPKKLGRIGGKAFLLYICTTIIAIAIAISIALLLHVGQSVHLTTAKQFTAQVPRSVKEFILNIFPSNPFKALVDGNLLQVILFAILFGIAISAVGKKSKPVVDFFQSANDILMKLILIIMKLAPYGVFCLLAALFAQVGFRLIVSLAGYFGVVLLVLFIQLTVVYVVFLIAFTRLNPIQFFRKLYPAIVFAFSVSSSNASIPVVLRTVEFRLGVNNSIASFIIPLGSTINMDGTAIMQGIATVFIANAYHLSIGLTGYLTVIIIATLSSIGTAGVPSVGLITLAMVLQQVGLPVEGIALIIGVDRLLDMARTAVNISGDAMISCVVAKTENALDEEVFYSGYTQND